MSRKARKHKRRLKQKKVFLTREETDAIVKRLEIRKKENTKFFKNISRLDRNQHGKIFNDNGRLGCYDYRGGKAYCKDCWYKDCCLKKEG